MATKNKYAEIVPHLPKLEEEASYQEKVNAEKARLTAAWEESQTPISATQIARLYEEVRTEKEVIEDELKTVQLRLTAIEQMLVNQYEIEDVSSVRLGDGVSVSVQLEPYAAVVDRVALKKWAITRGYEDKLTLPWQLINAVLKDHLVNGEAEPDGVKAFVRAKFVLRR